MPLADYAHWNEDAERIWWEEEGKHDTNEPPEPDQDHDFYDAAEAFAEELAELEDDELLSLRTDPDYQKPREQQAIIEAEIKERGL